MGQTSGSYPVTPNTINNFAKQIMAAIRTNTSVTFLFPQNIGGTRAWIKFLLDKNSADNIYNQINQTHHFIVIEPYEMIEPTCKAFFYSFLKQLPNKQEIKNYQEMQLDQILDQIHKIISQLVQSKPLAVFIVKLDTIPNFDDLYGNPLYSICKKHLHKVIFISTLHEDSHANILKRLNEFSEILNEHVINIPQLSNEDISHVINHWETKLNHKFNQIEKGLIHKHSNKSAHITKAICQLIAMTQEDDSSELGKQISTMIQNKFSSTNKRNIIKTRNNRFYLSDKDLTPDLTHTEQKILQTFLNYNDQFISREQIAKILWDDKIQEKYSDMAIDKSISLLRKKISKYQPTTKIQAVKAKGYRLVFI